MVVFSPSFTGANRFSQSHPARKTSTPARQKVHFAAKKVKIDGKKTKVPGTGLFTSFVADAVDGIVPYVGDVTSLGRNLYLIKAARDMGASWKQTAALLGFSAVDFGTGLVPLIGDVPDEVMTSNMIMTLVVRNLLKKYAGDTVQLVKKVK